MSSFRIRVLYCRHNSVCRRDAITETISTTEARRLALARAGLLFPERTGLPARGARASRRECYSVIRRFGYLQLDTIPIAGARSHALVLLSRLDALDPAIPETLLRPKAPLFEYWGHEASWIPMELYPVFEFRRREYKRASPWWGPLLKEHRTKANAIRRRIRDEGALRSSDLDDKSERNDWGTTLSRRLLRSLWWAGEIAVRERKRFQPLYDLTERVIPEKIRQVNVAEREAVKLLLVKALDGHGWATTKTLVATWRLTKRQKLIKSCLDELREAGTVASCSLDGRTGWVRPEDLELAARLVSARPRTDTPSLLSPFDPVLWDRDRVQALFDFEQVLEIFKPAHQRKYGYYCMPVLAGERLIARCDLKADRKAGRLDVLSIHTEARGARALVNRAIARYASTLGLSVSR